MTAPADRTAKRVSAKEWFASLALLRRREPAPGAGRAAMPPPVDRIAVRA